MNSILVYKPTHTALKGTRRYNERELRGVTVQTEETVSLNNLVLNTVMVYSTRLVR